jgi:glycosyltransferase involved in cell wall biosynthesis
MRPAGDGRSPTFSVLIAAHNHGAYIEETLDSVAAQTVDDYELVLVDDGSTDDTGDIAARWLATFRLRHRHTATLLTIDNSGQSAAFERGFTACRGTYVCLLDSDDRWLPTKLALVQSAVEAAPDAGMIVHPLFVIGADGRRTGDLRPGRARLSEGDLRSQVLTTGRHVAPATSGVVIRTDVFGSLLPMPTKAFRSGADSYLTFGASLRAPVAVIPEPLAEYRLHGESHYLGRMLSPDGLERSVALQRTILDHFGLASVAGKNSFFARNVFALAKLRGGMRAELAAFSDLVWATLRDPAFHAGQRLLLTGYWLVCLCSPRPLFARLWRSFQLRQTGYAKVMSRARAPRGRGREA